MWDFLPQTGVLLPALSFPVWLIPLLCSLNAQIKPLVWKVGWVWPSVNPASGGRPGSAPSRSSRLSADLHPVRRFPAFHTRLPLLLRLLALSSSPCLFVDRKHSANSWTRRRKHNCHSCHMLSQSSSSTLVLPFGAAVTASSFLLHCSLCSSRSASLMQLPYFVNVLSLYSHHSWENCQGLW